MEAPPPMTAPPLSAAISPAIPPSHLNNYPDSVDSSPRSRNADSWDDPFPPTTTISKLRLMCSYGGHIVPRPHDKSLCYVGGDTRIVVIDRHNTSLSDLSSRLSKTFLNNRPFTLKYQLPSEDLDSLISVTTDEDFDNMIDEYDRTASNSSSSVKPSRIRLFLFPIATETSQSIGTMLDNSAKSDDWFLNALNGTGVVNNNRGFSESDSVNCLLGLDDEGVGVGVGVVGGGNSNLDVVSRENEVVASQQSVGSFGNNVKNLTKQGQDVHSVPDSPMLETTSSFGSTSSSPSLANLPPIRVHVVDDSGVRMQDQKVVVGIEDQFAQMGVGGQRQDEGFVVLSSPPPPVVPANMANPVVVPISSAAAGEYPNRVFSDDERSDHGVPIGYRKQTAQQQPQPQPQNLPPQFQQKSAGGIDLPSPDSVSSDGSLSNSLSRPKPVIYQEQVQIPTVTTRFTSNPADPVKLNMSDPHTRIQIQQQVQDPGYVLQQQFDPHQQQPQQQQQKQQYVPNSHFIHHTPAGAVPIPAYYPVYPSQQQSHPQHHPQLDQQYPVYYMPARQAQPYNIPMQQQQQQQQQPNIGEANTAIPSSRPQAQPNPTMAPSSAAYNPVRNVPIPKAEMAAGAYRTSAGMPQLVQVPSTQPQHQHQQQFVAYSQIHHPSQGVAPNSAAPANYAYDYADPAHAQIYYTQPLAPTMPSQYQTMAAPSVVLPEVSSQLPSDSIKQQIRTSQPI